jgi:hypothetical protein
MDIIRSLIDRIKVAEGEERGKLDVILVGALAAILAFPKKIPPLSSLRTAVGSCWLRGQDLFKLLLSQYQRS